MVFLDIFHGFDGVLGLGVATPFDFIVYGVVFDNFGTDCLQFTGRGVGENVVKEGHLSVDFRNGRFDFELQFYRGSWTLIIRQEG